jgi:WD40 repeat protein
MDDTLTQPSLYELLARIWPLDGAVGSLVFNRSESAVAFATGDGRIAVVPLSDAEPPGKRVRIEFDTGRTTIRPRANPVPAPTIVGPLADGRAPLLTAFGVQGFCVAAADGSLHRVTARGQSLRFTRPDPDPVTALHGLGETDSLAVARGCALALVDATGTATAEVRLDAPAGVLAVTPDLRVLAVGDAGGVSLLDGAGLAPLRRIDLGAAVVSLAWDAAGRTLAIGCADRSAAVLTLGDGAPVDRIGGFPEAPQSLALASGPAALVASGTYRVAAWSLRGDRPEPVKTGRAGLVLVDRVAAHPSRGIVAAGYASGLVILCHLGEAGEVLLRSGTSGPDRAVSALAWSADGRHLALGTAGGEAAIVTFPDQFFK